MTLMNKGEINYPIYSVVGNSEDRRPLLCLYLRKPDRNKKAYC